MAPIKQLVYLNFALCTIYLCPSTGATEESMVPLDHNLFRYQISLCALKKASNRYHILTSIANPRILGHYITTLPVQSMHRISSMC